MTTEAAELPGEGGLAGLVSFHQLDAGNKSACLAVCKARFT